MQTISTIFVNEKESLYKWASALALITIFYNIAEGIISVFFGLEDETFALFGFGLDSFVEVISGVGIWHMVKRLRENNNSSPDRFEKRALRITGTAFFILFFGLVAVASVNLYQGHKPETTFWGIIISAISIILLRGIVEIKWS